jgi:hypothetical protein
MTHDEEFTTVSHAHDAILQAARLCIALMALAIIAGMVGQSTAFVALVGGIGAILVHLVIDLLTSRDDDPPEAQ